MTRRNSGAIRSGVHLSDTLLESCGLPNLPNFTPCAQRRCPKLWYICLVISSSSQWHPRPPSRRHISTTVALKTDYSKRIQKQSHSALVDSTEHVVSYDGTGQYSGDGMGASACGLAALNFARVAFSIEQGGLQDSALLQALLARECSEVTSIVKPPTRARPCFPQENPWENHRYMRIMVW